MTRNEEKLIIRLLTVNQLVRIKIFIKKKLQKEVVLALSNEVKALENVLGHSSSVDIPLNNAH